MSQALTSTGSLHTQSPSETTGPGLRIAANLVLGPDFGLHPGLVQFGGSAVLQLQLP